MPRYVAFLRGVSPMNAKMADLKRCFEAAGFTDVKTVLSSGNVVFDARAKSETALAQAAEAAMPKRLGRTFATIVRSTADLQAMIDTDPFATFSPSPKAKRIVTFLRDSHTGALSLPIETDGVRMLATTGREVFITYLPNPKGPVFMTLIEKTFGVNVTTRTWETVRRCARA
jgi:uncharacterized protein (DUF1697 family)